MDRTRRSLPSTSASPPRSGPCPVRNSHTDGRYPCRNIISAVAGYTADASSLVNYCRNAAQTHLSQYNENMPVEQLVKRVCDMKQGYTQYGGLRPFGVSFLFAGHDPMHQFQLYSSDPSGNYSGWRAHCIGANNSTATSLLKQDYKEDIGLEDALELAVKVLSKTMDSTTLDHEKGGRASPSHGWLAVVWTADFACSALTLQSRSPQSRTRKSSSSPLRRFLRTRSSMLSWRSAEWQRSQRRLCRISELRCGVME